MSQETFLYPIALPGSRFRDNVLSAEVMDIDPDQRRVLLRDGELAYDTLIVASGSGHHYFGHEARSRS